MSGQLRLTGFVQQQPRPAWQQHLQRHLDELQLGFTAGTAGLRGVLIIATTTTAVLNPGREGRVAWAF